MAAIPQPDLDPQTPEREPVPVKRPWPDIPLGAIVSFLAPGSRSTEGVPREIPAIVLGQNPDDGVLTLFAFHFEGQFMGRTSPDQVKLLYDPRSPMAGEGVTVEGLDALYERIEDLEGLRGQVNKLDSAVAELEASQSHQALLNKITGVMAQVGVLRSRVVELEKQLEHDRQLAGRETSAKAEG